MKIIGINIYGEFFTDSKCECCNGTGEVHSHNPTCWECSGNGSHTITDYANRESRQKRVRGLEKKGVSEEEILKLELARIKK